MMGVGMTFAREFKFPIDRLLPNSPYQAMKELLRKSEQTQLPERRKDAGERA